MTECNTEADQWGGVTFITTLHKYFLLAPRKPSLPCRKLGWKCQCAGSCRAGHAAGAQLCQQEQSTWLCARPGRIIVAPQQSFLSSPARALVAQQPKEQLLRDSCCPSSCTALRAQRFQQHQPSLQCRDGRVALNWHGVSRYPERHPARVSSTQVSLVPKAFLLAVRRQKWGNSNSQGVPHT